jgi:hypothetical protein
VFCVGYVLLYRSIVHFRTPRLLVRKARTIRRALRHQPPVHEADETRVYLNSEYGRLSKSDGY